MQGKAEKNRIGPIMKPKSALDLEFELDFDEPPPLLLGLGFGLGDGFTFCTLRSSVIAGIYPSNRFFYLSVNSPRAKEKHINAARRRMSLVLIFKYVTIRNFKKLKIGFM